MQARTRLLLHIFRIVYGAIAINFEKSIFLLAPETRKLVEITNLRQILQIERIGGSGSRWSLFLLCLSRDCQR